MENVLIMSPHVLVVAHIILIAADIGETALAGINVTEHEWI
jgi:hypothetical protein